MHCNRGRVVTAIFAGVVLLLGFKTASATPVLSFDETTGAGGANNDQSVGWQFDVLAPIKVTGLGWFDEGADGLALGHMVGIWSPGGVLLASVFVPAGGAAPLDGQFRTANIPDILLLPGVGYIVGGQNFQTNTERLACGGFGACDGAMTQTVDPRISFFDAMFSNIGGFQRPDQFSLATEGFYGPSFSVGEAIPEPGTVILLGTGLLVCALAARRRQS